jgi:hypothetical protein
MKKRNFTGSLERPPQPSPRAKTALQRLKDCRMAGPGVDRAVASKRCSQLAKAEGKGGLALRFHEDGLSRGSEEHARVREEMQTSTQVEQSCGDVRAECSHDGRGRFSVNVA